MRPLVAITATSRLRDGVQRVQLNQAYVASVEAAGMIPVVVPPLQSVEATDTLLDRVDGLLLSGGEDVDPALYVAEAHPATHPRHGRRDATELQLARGAHARSLPTLAICRGVQLLNVALGGTLIQDIPSELPDSTTHDANEERRTRVHEVRLEPASRLALSLGATCLGVNSVHHQALARVAAGLRVTAHATDGIVEGVEWDGEEWWALGVQWHPEELTDTPEEWDRRLFAAFAQECTTFAVARRAAADMPVGSR